MPVRIIIALDFQGASIIEVNEPKPSQRPNRRAQIWVKQANANHGPLRRSFTTDLSATAWLLGTKADWLPLMPALSQHFHCICLDLPGHGDNQAEGSTEARLDLTFASKT